MNFVFVLAAALVLVTALYLRYLAVPLVWRWLKAGDPGSDPVWEKVRESTREVARQQRRPVPGLRVLPEFAPNAIVLRHRGRTELGLTEGLVRTLGAEELEATIALCLCQSAETGRRRQIWAGLLLFPFARRIAQAPLGFRVFLSPVFSFFLRLLTPARACFSADAAAARFYGPWQVAATLQKLAVIGRKIPVRRWNLALDSLFVVAPLALDEGPHWLIHAQPSVRERRERLLAGAVGT